MAATRARAPMIRQHCTDAGQGFVGADFAEQATYAMKRLALRSTESPGKKLRLRIENELLLLARTLRKRNCLQDPCTLARCALRNLL